MSANKLEIDPAIRSATWVPSYLRTNVFPDFGGKKVAMTIRLEGVTPMAQVEKVTNIMAIYADVNNNIVPYEKTWITFGSDMVDSWGGRRYAVHNFNGTINPGETKTFDWTDNDITTNHIVGNIGSNAIGGTVNVPGGLQRGASIPQNGILRQTLTNTTGSPINMNGTISLRYFQPADVMGQNMFNYGMRSKHSPVFSEFNENGIPVEAYESMFRKLYELQKANDSSIQSPRDTEIYCDYFDGLSGFSIDKDMGSLTLAQARARMDSQASARLRPGDGNGTSFYFTTQAYDYRNRMVEGYQNGVVKQINGKYLYNHIASLEASYIALDNRKVGTFGTGAFEGVQSIENQGTFNRLRFNEYNGDLERLGQAQASFGMSVNQAFFALLIGDTMVLWNGGAICSLDKNCHVPANYGGAAGFKNLFHYFNGTTVEYTGGAGQPPQNNCEYQFPPNVSNTENATFAGAWLYSKIKNRVNTTLRYSPYSYVNNAGSQTGYFNGNTPVPGIFGDGSVSRIDHANIGNHTIADQYFYKKPIVMDGSGSEGRVVIILNIRAGEIENIAYSVTTSTGSVEVINHVGSSLGVYLIS